MTNTSFRPRRSPSAKSFPSTLRPTFRCSRPPLLDAIGRTIDELGERLSKLAESDRPGLVILAVLTDGLENASTKYKWKDIASRIRHQQDAYQWKFLFLGANQDAIATAAKMSIDHIDAANINAADFDSAGRAVARKSSSHRTNISGGRLTPREQHDLSAPLQELADDESEKKKKKTKSPGA